MSLCTFFIGAWDPDDNFIRASQLNLINVRIQCHLSYARSSRLSIDKSFIWIYDYFYMKVVGRYPRGPVPVEVWNRLLPRHLAAAAITRSHECSNPSRAIPFDEWLIPCRKRKRERGKTAMDSGLCLWLIAYTVTTKLYGPPRWGRIVGLQCSSDVKENRPSTCVR